jgi:serine/threonine protein kinase
MNIGMIINNYKLVKLLGTNTIGSLFIGEKQILQGNSIITKLFTIRVIDLGKVSDQQLIIQEVDTLIRLSINPVSNRYMICYYESFIYNNNLVVVSDYLSGPTLQELVINKQLLDLSQLLQIMNQIAESVEYIHSNNIAHQNLKPSNIVFDNSIKRYKLIDFGYSCSINLNKQCKGKVGTVYYMSPELLQSNIDPSDGDFTLRLSNDMWSVGVIYYQLANPHGSYINFTGNDPVSIQRDIQFYPINLSNYPYVPINSIIATLLNKNYTQRPTANQLCILIKLARPLCIVNNKPFDRDMAQAILSTFNIPIDPNITDYSLCTLLNDQLNICQINNNGYDKDNLIRLAKVLGIEVNNMSGSKICSTLQIALKNEQLKYSIHITEAIIVAIEYLIIISTRYAGDPQPELRTIKTKLELKYTELYNDAKKLGLINNDLLMSVKNDMLLKASMYNKISTAYSKIYSDIAQQINNILTN